jgi:hypothetical protein
MRVERAEGGLAHAERAEDSLRRESVERLTGDAPDELAQHLVARVGIDESRPGRALERLARLSLEDLGGRAGVDLDRVVRRETGPMDEQLLDGDLRAIAAAGGDLRQESGRRIAETQLPLFDEDHHRRSRRDGLRQRGDVEDRVESHRLFLREEGAEAEGLAVEDPVLAADEHDGSRELASGDRLLDHRVDPRERPRGRTCIARRHRRGGEEELGDHGRPGLSIPAPRTATPGIVTGSRPAIGASPNSARAAATWTTV